MPRIDKKEKLDQLTSDYLEAVSKLFPNDQDMWEVLDEIPLSDAERKVVDKLELDSLSTLVIASILGY